MSVINSCHPSLDTRCFNPAFSLIRQRGSVHMGQDWALPLLLSAVHTKRLTPLFYYNHRSPNYSEFDHSGYIRDKGLVGHQQCDPTKEKIGSLKTTHVIVSEETALAIHEELILLNSKCFFFSSKIITKMHCPCALNSALKETIPIYFPNFSDLLCYLKSLPNTVLHWTSS